METSEIIIGLIIGVILFFWFSLIRPKERKKNQSMTDIIKNDPVLNELDKEIEEINKRSHERMKTYDPDWIELLKKLNGSNEDKKNWVDEQKQRRINKIEEYHKLKYINNIEKQKYINDFIENKKTHIFSNHNDVSTLNMSDTDTERWGYLLTKLDGLLENDERRFNLAKNYGKDIAQSLVLGLVWLNMTSSELIASRGTPDDEEKELTKDGEIEIFIYGNKKTGSYFTLQNDKVIKLKDRGK